MKCFIEQTINSLGHLTVMVLVGIPKNSVIVISPIYMGKCITKQLPGR